MRRAGAQPEAAERGGSRRPLGGPLPRGSRHAPRTPPGDSDRADQAVLPRGPASEPLSSVPSSAAPFPDLRARHPLPEALPPGGARSTAKLPTGHQPRQEAPAAPHPLPGWMKDGPRQRQQQQLQQPARAHQARTESKRSCGAASAPWRVGGAPPTAAPPDSASIASRGTSPPCALSGPISGLAAASGRRGCCFPGQSGWPRALLRRPWLIRDAWLAPAALTAAWPTRQGGPQQDLPSDQWTLYGRRLARVLCPALCVAQASCPRTLGCGDAGPARGRPCAVCLTRPASSVGGAPETRSPGLGALAVYVVPGTVHGRGPARVWTLP